MLWVFSINDEEHYIECINMSLDEIAWEYSTSGYEQKHIQSPIKVGESLIHNLGYQRTTNLKGYVEAHNGAIIGLSLDRGEEIWRTEFDFLVSSMINSDGRLLIAYFGYLVEIDSVTGKELKRIDTQLLEAHKLGWDLVAVHDMGECLVFISSGDFSISIHDKATLEQIQVVRIPDSYGIHATHKPIVKDGTVYIALRGSNQDASRPSDYLLMKLTPCERVEEAVSMMEEKPPHKISVVSEPQNQESYRIDLDAITPDQLIRLAEVEVALIPGNHGKTMWGAPDKNPKFNGKISFYGTLPKNIVEAEIERARSYLKLLKEYWDELAAGEMGPYGSVKGTLIDLSCYLNNEKVA